MKTDTIFYQLFQEFPQIFFELIEQPNVPPDIYQFIAPEIKQSSFRLDGIFSPPDEFSQYPLYFVEVQCYKEEDFYDRLFSSIFLYFRQYRPLNPDWLAIIIFDLRANDVAIPARYQALVNQHLQRIYLDEMEAREDVSLGLGVIRLIVKSPTLAVESARSLLNRARTEVIELSNQRQIIDLIETIIVYKFPKLSRQEIEAMLRLEGIKQTRVYQEAVEEGELKQKLAMIPRLAQKGFSVDEIAELVQLDRETVRKAIED